MAPQGQGLAETGPDRACQAPMIEDQKLARLSAKPDATHSECRGAVRSSSLARIAAGTNPLMREQEGGYGDPVVVAVGALSPPARRMATIAISRYPNAATFGAR